MSNKQTMKEAGCKQIISLGLGAFIVIFNDSSKEIWNANKNHASYGIIYKNTHLEFSYSIDDDMYNKLIQ